jgi:hypothetical protein
MSPRSPRAQSPSGNSVSAASNTGRPNGTLSFDDGTFDVNTLNMAPKSGGGTGTARATLNIGGGTFTVNTAFTMGSPDGCRSFRRHGEPHRRHLLDGGFNIDTSAADALESGTWTLENVSTLTGPYGSNFSVIGFTNAGANKWTKTNGAKLYTFDETTGVLTLAPADAYAGWALAKGLDGTPGKEAGKGDDPDNDGRNNLCEFAFDGNPLSGANDGKIVGKPAPVGPDEVLTLTLPVRNGAVFPVSPGALVSNPIDGIRYIIEGDGSLSPFDDGITEIPAITAGLPGLSAGWSYRTFRSPGIVPTVPKAFLRAKVSEAP